MRERGDIGTVFTRALESGALSAGCRVTVVRADWRQWASATFVGARHHVMISASATPALDTWLAGHLVADLVVKATRRQSDQVEADIEALTVESW